MKASRFRSTTIPFVAMIVLAAFQHTPLTVACAAVFVAGVLVVCTSYLVDELRGRQSAGPVSDGS